MAKQLIVLAVPAAATGSRLDQVLHSNLAEFSRSFLAKMIEAGRVTVDGRRAKPAMRLRGGEEIRFAVPPRDAATIEPEPIPLHVLYEDEDLIVINKPPGLVVHPGAGRRTGTLVNALLDHCPALPLAGSPLRPGIVHRLDKDTSGVMVAAKTDFAAQSLSSQFARREVEKTYVGLVWGEVRPSEGVVDAPLGRSTRDRKKISVSTRKPREARTSYRVIGRSEEFTLLELVLATGRTHQIRVHLKHLGHPLVGDKTYGGRRGVPSPASPNVRDAVKSMTRQALHAKTLAFRHPRTGDRVRFEAPLAADLSRLIAAVMP